MAELKVYDFYEVLSRDSFVLIYLGEFDDVLTSILMDINDASKSEMRTSRKKISYLIAECFQNIIRHSDKINRDIVVTEIPEMFILRDRNTIHHLVTTNLVKNTYITDLCEKLDTLQKLNPVELKQLYMEVFSNNEKSDKGGAGLGLIDMARKSGVAPSYQFVNLGNDYSNFFMQVNILPKEFAGELTADDTSLDSALSVYDQMTANNVLIAQKGDFSQEAVLPLIQLFENNLNLKDEHVAVARRVLYLLIEMLQNMTRHAQLVNGIREGVFFIAENGPRNYEISTGNFITHENAQKLKAHLDSIADLDKIALSKKYREKLMDGDEEAGKGAGIGLIELCRHSTHRINYDLRSTENGLAFFSLHVKV